MNWQEVVKWRKFFVKKKNEKVDYLQDFVFNLVYGSNTEQRFKKILI